ncbi:MAG: hypothetical protein ABI763_16865 [Bacteroidota bacterium]
MKILFLTSRFPYPLEKGDKLRAFYQIVELSKKHQVILAAVSDELVLPEHIEKLKPYCRRILIHNISKAKQIQNLARALVNGKPFQVEYFFSKEFKKKIQKIITEDKPDAVFCQLVRMAEYVRDEKQISKTLDYQDAFSKGYERQAQRENIFKKIPVMMEWKRMLKYEGQIFNDFNNKIIISEQDRDLISHPDRSKIEVIPNGVDFNYYSPQQKEKKYDLIFSGNMNYPPNIESAHYIVEKIMPLLLGIVPGGYIKDPGLDEQSREAHRWVINHMELKSLGKWCEDRNWKVGDDTDRGMRLLLGKIADDFNRALKH